LCLKDSVWVSACGFAFWLAINHTGRLLDFEVAVKYKGFTDFQKLTKGRYNQLFASTPVSLTLFWFNRIGGALIM